MSVAPTSRATSSLAATRSIATIRDAPATAAPITHDSPTPPRPITATDDPAGTSAVLSTAPTPVVTQQPMSAAAAGSTPSGSGIAAAAGTTDASAIVAIAQYDRTPRNAVSPSSKVCRYDGESGQAHTAPRRHDRQLPHGISQDSATS